MANPLNQIFFSHRKAFRNWLESNYNTSSGIWIKFYKKHTNRECIDYEDALEEALCFGWIDSLIKKIDDNCYVRKFTPRSNRVKWSELNKKTVTSLIEKGLMTEAGLMKIDSYVKTGKVEWQSETETTKRISSKDLAVPEFMIEEFSKHEPALTNFNKLPNSHKKQYVIWITNAKRQDTIAKRLKEAVVILKQGCNLGLR